MYIFNYYIYLFLFKIVNIKARTMEVNSDSTAVGFTK